MMIDSHKKTEQRAQKFNKVPAAQPYKNGNSGLAD